MKNTLSTMILIVCMQIGHTAYAQDASNTKLKMQTFAFLVGEWTGTGSSMTRDQGMVTFDVVESISFELDSTILLIGGKGESNSQKVHDALAVLYFDAVSGNFRMHSYIMQGQNTIAKFELTGEKSFKWWFNDPTGGTITYTASLTEDTWTESGSYTTPDGRSFPTMSMNLTRRQ